MGMELTVPEVGMLATKMTGTEFIPWRGTASREVFGGGVMTSVHGCHTPREKALP